MGGSVAALPATEPPCPWSAYRVAARAAGGKRDGGVTNRSHFGDCLALEQSESGIRGLLRLAGQCGERPDGYQDEPERGRSNQYASVPGNQRPATGMQVRPDSGPGSRSAPP